MTDKDDAVPMLTPHALGFEPPKKRKTEEDDEEDEMLPEPEPGPVFIDPFVDEIKKLRGAQSPAMKEAIDNAECFGRRWYIDPKEDPEEGGICPQTDCDLRSLCELLYTRVGKTETSTEKSEPTPKRKLRRPHRRFPYVAQGRPVDKLADKLWRLTGGPPALTQGWMYPPVAKPEDLEVAQQIFIERFGSGILVVKRVNYHMYFLDGLHLMRFWVRHPGGGWLDVSETLSQKIEKTVPTMDQEDMSDRLKQHAHRWFPKRVYIGHHQHLIQLEKVFTAMGIVPV